MGGLDGRRGAWGIVYGGMGAVSESIANAACEYGTEIRLNQVHCLF
jgi:phytoene dehydrogenase-like protein